MTICERTLSQNYMNERPLDGGEALLAAFRRLGIEYVISSPGSEWSPVWEALARQKVERKNGPKYIGCWHETTAVAMGIGYTNATEKMVAVLLHTGVGLLQGSLPIRSAYMAQVPLLICVGESTSYGADPHFDPGSHWLTDLTEVGGPARLGESISKWSATVGSSWTLYGSAVRAGEISKSVPQGPVILSLPMEVMQGSWSLPSQRPEPPQISRHQPDSKTIGQIANILSKSRSPVILTEACGRSEEGFARLIELAEILSIPVIETGSPLYANFPKDHPLHMGYDIAPFLDETDFFLVISCRAPWYPLTISPPKGSTVVILDENPIRPQLVYQSLQADIFVEANVASSLSAIVDAVRSNGTELSGTRERKTRWESQHYAMQEARSKKVQSHSSEKPINATWLCASINEVMPNDAIYVEETIVHSGTIFEHIRWNQPRSFFHPVGGGLGLGLGLALGTKLAIPERPVVCLIGDGAFLYNPIIPFFGASREYDLPILVIIFNNTGYASMKRAHLRSYPGGMAERSDIFYGSKILGPNYSDLIRPFGGYGERVEEPEQLKGALQNGLDAVRGGRSALIDVLLSTSPPKAK